MQQRFLFLLAALFLLPAFCHGDILLNQAPDTNEFAFAEHDFTNVPISSSFIVDDITLNSSSGLGYTIDSVTTYFRVVGGDVSGITTGVLNVISNDGVLDTEALTLQPVTIDVTTIPAAPVGPIVAVTASGLNLSLADGDYWIGLTPTFDSSLGQTQRWTTTSGSINGQQAHWINPGEGFTLGPDWVPSEIFGEGAYDASLLVEGTENVVPEPTSALVLTVGLLALTSRRRR